MHTKEISDRVVRDMRHVGRSGEDSGGIPIVAGLTLVMVVILLFALGFLFFNAPSAGSVKRVNQVPYVNDEFDFIQGQKPGATLPRQQGPTIDENPMSRSGSVYVK